MAWIPGNRQLGGGAARLVASSGTGDQDGPAPQRQTVTTSEMSSLRERIKTIEVRPYRGGTSDIRGGRPDVA